MSGQYRSRVYTDRPDYADFDAPEKFQAITGIIMTHLRQHVRMWQSYGSRNRNDGYKGGWKNDVIGRERMYALWSWYRLPEWIVEIAERLRKVQIENRPALDVIQKHNSPGIFQYIDPPYLLGTRSRKQYQHEMTDADHEDLLKAILQSKAKIMISGYESEMYNGYLNGWHKEYFRSCADGGKPRQETVWMNYEHHRQMVLEDMGVAP